MSIPFYVFNKKSILEEEHAEKHSEKRKNFSKLINSNDMEKKLEDLYQRDIISSDNKSKLLENKERFFNMNPVLLSIVFDLEIYGHLTKNSSSEYFDTVINENMDNVDIKIKFLLGESPDVSTILKLKLQLRTYWNIVKNTR